MNIQNIQIAQGLFRTAEERLNSGKGNVSSSKDAPLPQVNVSDAQTVEAPKVSNERDLMAVVYPPFFPIGSTQDILSIEAVKQMTGEHKKSAPSADVEGQKAVKQPENGKSIHPDESVVKAKAPQVKHEDNPRVVIELTV